MTSQPAVTEGILDRACLLWLLQLDSVCAEVRKLERIWNRAFQLLLLEEWIWEHDNETRKTLWKPYCTTTSSKRDTDETVTPTL